jgi:site-specific DNA-methyltransferase (adenine-specific)
MDKQLVRKFGEVFTPLPLVNEMLDKLPSNLWSNPDLKWIDPSCGNGNFLLEIKNRLLKNFSEEHILTNMIYGVEIQQKNCIEAINRIGKFNLVCADALKFDYWNGMQFDVVVGNPPYNTPIKIKSRISQSSDLYPAFTDLAYSLLKEKGYLIFITPSRWFGKTQHTKFKYRMTSQYGMIGLWHTNNKSFFTGTQIGGGISYFLIQKGYSGKTYLNFLNEEFDLKSHPTILVTKNPLGLEIINKVKNIKTINSLCYSQIHFGIKTNSKFFSDIQHENYIPCIVSKIKGSLKYVPFDQIKNSKDISKWKVILRAADGRGSDYTNYYILGEPGTIHNESFVSFLFNTKEEALNFISYFKTKLFKYLMSLRKIKQTISKEVFSLIPKINFNKKWSDEELYSYFKFTNEEIQLIESVINK